MHLWLTPFIAGGDHLVELQFEEEAEVAMIRIWVHDMLFLIQFKLS